MIDERIETAPGLVAIVGRRVTEVDFPELAGRIGEDEAAIVIADEDLQRQLTAQNDIDGTDE